MKEKLFQFEMVLYLALSEVAFWYNREVYGRFEGQDFTEMLQSVAGALTSLLEEKQGVPQDVELWETEGMDAVRLQVNVFKDIHYWRAAIWVVEHPDLPRGMVPETSSLDLLTAVKRSFGNLEQVLRERCLLPTAEEAV